MPGQQCRAVASQAQYQDQTISREPGSFPHLEARGRSDADVVNTMFVLPQMSYTLPQPCLEYTRALLFLSQVKISGAENGGGELKPN